MADILSNISKVSLSREIQQKYTLQDSTLTLTTQDDVGREVVVEIGDSANPDSFLIHKRVIKGEAEYSLSLPTVSQSLHAPVFLQDKIICTDDNIVVHFSDIPEDLEADVPSYGGYETEIVVNSKPESNVISLNLETKNIEFHKQPDNSYVGFYIQSLAEKQFTITNTFKILPISMVDSEGIEAKGDMNITQNPDGTGTLDIIIPEDFYNNAVYPIIIDPTDTFTTAGSGTWTSPSDVVSPVTVELWGGGGGGSRLTGTGNGNGGGGGEYATSSVAVAPSTGYDYVVGTGGTGSTGGNGQDSTFATTTVVAKRGTSAGTDNSNGSTPAGGTGGTGDTKYAGGNGANGASTYGGGGGSSGGTSSAGNSATDRNGASAVTGGGPGGNGRQTTQGNGSAPASGPGGGGGGGYSTSGIVNGGNGFAGKVSITYTTGVGALTPSVSDTTTPSDSVAISIPKNYISVIDTTTPTDSFNVSLFSTPASISVTDTTTPTDSVVTLIPKNYVSVLDSATPTDLINVLIPSNSISVLDSTAPTDSVTTSIPKLYINVNDSTVPTDSVIASIPKDYISVLDSTTPTDLATVLLPSNNISVSDTTTPTDSVVTSIPKNYVSVIDTTTPTDSFNVYLNPLNISVTDSATPGDSIITQIPTPGVLTINVNDSTAPTDSATTLIPNLYTGVSDSTTPTDLATVQIPNLYINTSDSASPNDGLDISLVTSNPDHLDVSVSDSTAPDEGVDLQLNPIDIDVTDGVTASDVIHILLSGAGAVYSKNASLYKIIEEGEGISVMLSSPRIPTWNTTGRPTGVLGLYGGNTDTGKIEWFDGTTWQS